MYRLMLFLIIIGYTLFDIRYVNGGTEAQMRELLFAKLNSTDYSPRVRPIKDTGSALNLYVDLYLVSINKVDEVARRITSTAYLKIVWSDVFMTWDPADYGGITEFSLPQNQIWKPDITLANAYDTISGLGAPFMYVVVTNDGNMTWEPYQIFESICKIDMTHFPFDTHVCNLDMATWSSTQDLIHIIPGSDGFDVSSFEENANWYLTNVSTFDSSTSLTSSLSFSFTIKRKPIYYILNVIIPIILLSFLNNFVFMLPCDSGEKLSYAIVLFLSFSIYLLIVIDTMPEELSSIPIVNIYLLFECVFSTNIVLITSVQLRLHNRGDSTPVPEFFKKITKGIRRIKNKLFCEFTEYADECVDSGRDSSSASSIPRFKTKKVDEDKEVFKKTLKDSPQIPNGFVSAAIKERENDRSNGAFCTSVFKRKFLCGANGTNKDMEVQLETVNGHYCHTSEKTSMRLSNILGKSNKVEPEIFFHSEKEVYPIYDKVLAMEDVDKVERILRENQDTIEDLDAVSHDSSLFEETSLDEEISKGRHKPDTETVESEPEKADDITWPEFVLAMDGVFFVLAAILNTIATTVTFVVSYLN